MPRYRIIDEPAPSALSKLAVKPAWPLFALMFAGPWLAYPWFVLNAFAIGSMGRWRQLAWAAGGFLGAGLLFAGVVALVGGGVIPKEAARYAMIAVMLWKLLAGYMLYIAQAPSFELHQYFGGAVRNGMFVLLIGAFGVAPAIDRNLEELAGAGAVRGFLSVVLL